MNSISIVKKGVTKLDVECVVNAANSSLRAGGGVCGAIFNEAGRNELQLACDKIGGCETGSAVITPGFALKCKYIIHAVGPVWNGGSYGEPELLYSCYKTSLELVKKHGCHSVAFPLISSGIFGYPKEEAWKRAIESCIDFCCDNPGSDVKIIFAVLDDAVLELGEKILSEELTKNNVRLKGTE